MEQTPVFVSFFLDASRPNSNGTCLIKMNVYQKPNKRRYGTKFHITKENWEKLNAPKLRDEKLKEIEKQLNALKARAEKIIEKTKPFSFIAFEELFFEEDQNASVKLKGAINKVLNSRMLTDWFNNAISIFEVNGQISSAGIYRTTINSINKFKKGLLLHDITPAFLLSYEKYLLGENRSLTTVGIYMRSLRAVMNNAIAGKIVSRDNYPFTNYQIPAGQNVKKALKNFDIDKILSYCPEKPDHQKAIDFWIFSYLCNGMNFADIVSLKPENINGRFLSFYRQKTIRTKKKDLRPIKVGLNQRALAIIDKWKNTDPNNPYLFPILKAELSAKSIKNRSKRFIKWVNKRMYEISEDLGIENKTSTYAARHTFSTVLKRKGVPISFIKDALGHSSVITTENYLGSFEDEATLLYADALTSFD